jgi:phosphoribosylformylglycinamidine synthase
MRAAVVMFPGLNADAEMLSTLRLAGFSTQVVWHTEAELPAGTDLVAIPGGFSYGDYLRCGALARVAKVVPALRAFAAAGGPVLGVCNGFQILTECHLLPGALTRNEHLRFECRDVWVKITGEGMFTPTVGATLRLPIAHAEGRYQASPDVLERLRGEGQIALVYASESGEVSQAHNPNGSALGIAGIYGGPRRNVLGLMPHPERMAEPQVGGVDGRTFFDAAFRALGDRAA